MRVALSMDDEKHGLLAPAGRAPGEDQSSPPAAIAAATADRVRTPSLASRWGARSSDPSRVAGIDNHGIVELHGVSKKIHVEGGDSSPADPSGTNTLTVIR